MQFRNRYKTKNKLAGINAESSCNIETWIRMSAHTLEK